MIKTICHWAITSMVVGLALVSPVASARADALAELKAKAGTVAYVDGMLKFHGAIEHLGQGLYRHGMAPPDTTGFAGLVPFFRLNLPTNPTPEKLDYQGFRAILARFVEEMDAAEASLAAAGELDVKVPVDLSQVGFDFNGDGKRDSAEQLSALIGGMLPTPVEGQPPPTSLIVNFDTADIYWIRGYGRITSALAQFLLAHDFEPMFNKTFHRLFPRAGLKQGDLLAKADAVGQGMITGAPQGDAVFADVIAAFHLMSWKTVEPQRLADVRSRLMAVTALSPKSWAAARAETDNDREWMPNSKQTQALTGSTNTDAQIDGWIEVMKEFEGILDGKKLMPHWRFDKGINIKRFFETSQQFDLVLMTTGTDAVAYVEDGDISGSARWNDLTSAFGGNFLGFALWYN